MKNLKTLSTVLAVSALVCAFAVPAQASRSGQGASLNGLGLNGLGLNGLGLNGLGLNGLGLNGLGLNGLGLNGELFHAVTGVGAASTKIRGYELLEIVLPEAIVPTEK